MRMFKCLYEKIKQQTNKLSIHSLICLAKILLVINEHWSCHRWYSHLVNMEDAHLKIIEKLNENMDYYN